MPQTTTDEERDQQPRPADAHHRELAAFVTDHRDPAEAYAGSDKNTAEIIEALLGWARAHHRDGRREDRP